MSETAQGTIHAIPVNVRTTIKQLKRPTGAFFYVCFCRKFSRLCQKLVHFFHERAEMEGFRQKARVAAAFLRAA